MTDAESARRALENMKGFTLAGRQIKVGRPSNMVTGGMAGNSEGSAVDVEKAAEGLAQATVMAHDGNSFLQAQTQAQNVHLTSVSKSG